MLRSEIPSGMRAELRTVAAGNNRDHARNLSYYCLLVLNIRWCYSSRTSRSWWITQSTQHHRRGCNSMKMFLHIPSPEQWFSTYGSLPKEEWVKKWVAPRRSKSAFYIFTDHCLSVSVCSVGRRERSRLLTWKTSLTTYCQNNQYDPYYFMLTYVIWGWGREVFTKLRFSDFGCAQKNLALEAFALEAFLGGIRCLGGIPKSTGSLEVRSEGARPCKQLRVWLLKESRSAAGTGTKYKSINDFQQLQSALRAHVCMNIFSIASTGTFFCE